MKKIIVSVCVVLLVLVLAVSCSGGNGGKTTDPETALVAAFTNVFNYYLDEFPRGGDISVNDRNFSSGGVSGTVKLDGYVTPDLPYDGSIAIEATVEYAGYEIKFDGTVSVMYGTPTGFSRGDAYVDSSYFSKDDLNALLDGYLPGI